MGSQDRTPRCQCHQQQQPLHSMLHARPQGASSILSGLYSPSDVANTHLSPSQCPATQAKESAFFCQVQPWPTCEGLYLRWHSCSAFLCCKWQRVVLFLFCFLSSLGVFSVPLMPFFKSSSFLKDLLYQGTSHLFSLSGLFLLIRRKLINYMYYLSFLTKLTAFILTLNWILD